MSTDAAEIEKVLQIYFDGLYEGDTKKLGAILEDGADLHTRRFEKAVQWFSDNWPAEAAWPEQIMRPRQTAEDAA